MSKRLLKREKIGILERLTLFEECSPRELNDLAAITVESNRIAGSFLTWEGRDGGLMFVIVEGEAEVLTGNDVKGYTRIGMLGPGDVVGELSLIDGRVRSASVRATTDVELLEITSDDFLKLIDRSPQFVRNLLRALSLKVRNMDARPLS
jgi:CRP/FNR family cyclic AMP-dependent transcriptional regulator